MYKPPFEISVKMLNTCMDISESLSKITSFHSLKRLPNLRKINKIHSIHSSLLIEANSLSFGQVRDVINGKNVIGSKKDIDEVKNAYNAYELINEFDGYNLDDLLKAHSILTNGLINDSGRFRRHAEGVFDGSKVIFIAPPFENVPHLMYDLFNWLKEDKETPLLIKSCVFHYEFVFIHPFTDGNGRLVRLWQNVLLTKWNKVFEYIPIESEIAKYQDEYYKAINESNMNGNSNKFIEFMLDMIDKTLFFVCKELEDEVSSISIQVNKLLSVMEYDKPLTANEIMDKLGIKSKETLRGSYLNPAIENGLIEMTIKDKPNSKNQKYIRK